MNILRDHIRKTKIRHGFCFHLGRKRATWFSLAACDCSWESTENCRSTCAAICNLRRVAAGLLRFAFPDPSIDRRSYMHAAGRMSGRLCFLRSMNKALGDDKDFFRERSAWSGRTLELERHLGRKRKFDSARRCKAVDSPATEIVQRPSTTTIKHLLCAAVKRQRSTWQRYRDAYDLELHRSENKLPIARGHGRTHA